MSYSSFNFLDYGRPILVFGKDGQVGKALQNCLKELKAQVIFLGRSDCDLFSESSIAEVLNRYHPQVIINSAAYTAVDKAQTEGEREHVFAINAKAPGLMARYIANISHGILVHYSTDYVFADTKQTAYLESDSTGPIDKLCVYGQSKLAGEQAIEDAFNIANDSNRTSHYPSYQDTFSRYFILRTSWAYGTGDNFIKKMLILASEYNQLKVVADQVGAPTSAQWLAEVSVQMVGSCLKSGIYHAVPDGEVSWHGLAVFAIETAASCGKGIKLKSENILPIPATNYPAPAPRPHNSRLSNQKLKNALSDMAFTGQYPHWRNQVEKYVKQVVQESLKS